MPVRVIVREVEFVIDEHRVRSGPGTQAPVQGHDHDPPRQGWAGNMSWSRVVT